MSDRYIHIPYLILSLALAFSSCRKKGCTDPTSLAYDSQAKKDNGSCTYPLKCKKALFLKLQVHGVVTVVIGELVC